MKCVLQQERKLMKRELQLIRKANKEGEVEKARLFREVTRSLKHCCMLLIMMSKYVALCNHVKPLQDSNIDAQPVLCTDRYASYDSSLLKCWGLI